MSVNIYFVVTPVRTALNFIIQSFEFCIYILFNGWFENVNTHWNILCDAILTLVLYNIIKKRDNRTSVIPTISKTSKNIYL